MAETFLDRHKGGENAFLVHVEYSGILDTEYEAKEFKLLVRSAGASIVGHILVKRKEPEIKYLIGRGKVDEIAQSLEPVKADLVIFNQDLSPAQERNLETKFECRVLDRTGLILDIFASRAQTHAGKLQVELAQLKHLSSRLIRGWSHLERQKGGIGLRGPGETQLESDRRMIGLRIKQINNKLAKVTSTRRLSRQARTKAGLPLVSLVGYTNAGKSTLFNRIATSRVCAADQLFATLDPTLRRLNLAPHGGVILADTVGFVSRLPHTLVESFKSTLEESINANLLVHVIDASQENYKEQKQEVEIVLAEIEADKIQILEVMNKIDRLDGFKPRIDTDANNMPSRVWLSALTGAGMDLFEEALVKIIFRDLESGRIILKPSEGNIRATLYEKADIIREIYFDDGSCGLNLRVSNRVLAELKILDRLEPI